MSRYLFDGSEAGGGVFVIVRCTDTSSASFATTSMGAVLLTFAVSWALVPSTIGVVVIKVFLVLEGTFSGSSPSSAAGGIFLNTLVLIVVSLGTLILNTSGSGLSAALVTFSTAFSSGASFDTEQQAFLLDL